EEEDPSPALRRMEDFGVMPAFASGMHFDRRMEEFFSRLRETISWYRLSFLDEPLDRWWVYLLGLYSNLKGQDIEAACSRVLLTPVQRDRMLWTFENAGRLLRSFFQVPGHTPSEIFRALQPFRPEELLFLMGRAETEETRRAVSHHLHRYRTVVTELRGKDLREMGVPPGPVYRKLLDELLDARLNGEVKSRYEEFQLLLTRHPRLFGDQFEEGEDKCIRPEPSRITE
ncbi:MAG: hypothetical protein LLG06_13960, partial [Desulfobacteraceae bacterium]|nr:hypothetical protein [Desulfobacteraceae bacterium]